MKTCLTLTTLLCSLGCSASMLHAPDLEEEAPSAASASPVATALSPAIPAEKKPEEPPKNSSLEMLTPPSPLTCGRSVEDMAKLWKNDQPWLLREGGVAMLTNIVEQEAGVTEDSFTFLAYEQRVALTACMFWEGGTLINNALKGLDPQAASPLLGAYLQHHLPSQEWDAMKKSFAVRKALGQHHQAFCTGMHAPDPSTPSAHSPLSARWNPRHLGTAKKTREILTTLKQNLHEALIADASHPSFLNNHTVEDHLRLAFFVGSKQTPSPKATPLTPSKERLLAYYWDLRHGVITQQAVKDLFPAPSAEALWTYPHRPHDPEAAHLALPSQHKIWFVPFVNGDHGQAADAFLSANVFPDMGASLMREERLAFYEELRKHMGEVIEHLQKIATDILKVLPEGEAFTGARNLCHRLLSVKITTGKDRVCQELVSLKVCKDGAKKIEKLLEKIINSRNKGLATLSMLEDKVRALCKNAFSRTQKEITEILNQKTEDLTGQANLHIKTKEAQSFWSQKKLVIDEIINHLDQGHLDEALTLYENDLANLGHEGLDYLPMIIATQQGEELKKTINALKETVANTLKEAMPSVQTTKEGFNTAVAEVTRTFKGTNHNLHHILFHHQRVSQMLYVYSIGKQLAKEMEAEPYGTPEISDEKFNLTWIQIVMDREMKEVNGFWQSFCALGKDWQPGQGVKAKQGVFQATEPHDSTAIKNWKDFEGLAQNL